MVGGGRGLVYHPLAGIHIHNYMGKDRIDEKWGIVVSGW